MLQRIKEYWNQVYVPVFWFISTVFISHWRLKKEVYPTRPVMKSVSFSSTTTINIYDADAAVKKVPFYKRRLCKPTKPFFKLFLKKLKRINKSHE
jgi:hypothetical protein